MANSARDRRIRAVIDAVLEKGRRIPPEELERFRAAWERQKAAIDPAGWKRIEIPEPGRGGYVN